MSSNGIGFILSTIFIFVMAYITLPTMPEKYADFPSFVIVFIGTGIIALISVPFDEMKLFFVMIKIVSRKYHDDSPEIVKTLVEMAEIARIDIQNLRSYAELKVKDPFLKDAVLLLVSGYHPQTLMKILRRRVEVQKERENRQANLFKNLGKYPPACGLLGTVLGMIALLGNLGQEGAGEMIGPAMSVALVATLYGVVITNFLILPVADNLVGRTERSIAKREMIIEGITLMLQKTNPIIVREQLASHLSPGMRMKLDEMSAGSSGQNAA